MQFADGDELSPEIKDDNSSVLCQAMVNGEVTHEVVNSIHFQLESVRQQARWGLMGSVIK